MFRVATTWILLSAVVGLVMTAGFSAPAADKKETAKPEVGVRIASWDETLKLVAAQKGNVVVLDAWSTSCQPCVKEFPNLVKLHRQYGEKGLKCMSLSCDYSGIKNKPPEFYKEKVLKFLSKQEATFENILASDPLDELLDRMQLSSIPAVYVFGRDGKLVKRFDNEKAEKEEDNFTYEDVTKLVVELLAKSK